MLQRRRAAKCRCRALAVHFHDTYGQALANILACLEEGVRVVDSAVSGTGGCPYAQGRQRQRRQRGRGLHAARPGHARPASTCDKLAETGRWLAALLGRETGSKVGKALAAA